MGGSGDMGQPAGGHDNSVAVTPVEPVEAVDVSVVVPVHNAEGVLGEQLAALAGQVTDVSFEVIVVLNRCTDGSARVVDDFRDVLRVRSVVADERAGAGYARNAGAAQANGAVLLFCDADDRVGERWVDELYDVLTRADFAGGRIVIDLAGVPTWLHPSTGSDAESLGGLQVWDNRLLYAMTASFGCRRAAFASVGGFDEEFPGATTEDAELAWRLFRAGHRMTFAPDAELHYRPRRRLSEVLRQRRGYARGNALMAAKEGWLIPTGRARGAAQACIAFADSAVGGIRARRPSLRRPLVAGATVHYRHQERRRLASSEGHDQQQPDPIVEYVIAFASPIIGGLAFSDRRTLARRSFREQPATRALAAVDSELRPGDRMLDLAPGDGAVAVAAALKVGERGAVVACETDSARAAIIRDNVARHRCDGQVAVAPARTVDGLPGQFDLVRLDPGLSSLSSVEEYCRFIERHSAARFLVPSELMDQGPTNEVVERFLSNRWVITRLDHATVAGGDSSALTHGADGAEPTAYVLAEPAQASDS